MNDTYMDSMIDTNNNEDKFDSTPDVDETLIEAEANDGVDEEDEVVDGEPITSPLKAIRAKCLDCCCGQKGEVKLCPAEDCPLWAFRFGKSPYRKGRSFTDEQRKAAGERMKKAREARFGKREDVSSES